MKKLKMAYKHLKIDLTSLVTPVLIKAVWFIHVYQINRDNMIVSNGWWGPNW